MQLQFSTKSSLSGVLLSFRKYQLQKEELYNCATVCYPVTDIREHVPVRHQVGDVRHEQPRHGRVGELAVRDADV